MIFYCSLGEFRNTQHNVIQKRHDIVAGKVSIENSDFKSLMKKISLQKYYRGFGVFWSGREKNILRFFILILLGNFWMLFYHAEESIFGLEAQRYLFFFQSRMSEKGEEEK